MYIQGVESIYDLAYNDTGVTYGDVFLKNEQQFSAYNFEAANTEKLFQHFKDVSDECRALVARNLPLPAYDQAIKASHLFNLLNARGVISVAERQAYIGRVRDLVKAVADCWVEQGK
jgi:glycyl-tRNA synthetase alpha chain